MKDKIKCDICKEYVDLIEIKECYCGNKYCEICGSRHENICENCEPWEQEDLD